MLGHSKKPLRFVLVRNNKSNIFKKKTDLFLIKYSNKYEQKKHKYTL